MRALAALLLLSLPSQAQGMCGNYGEMVKTLIDRYGETSIGQGIQAERFLIEVFTSHDTFTVLRTDGMGQACIIAAGKGWQSRTPEPKGQDT